MARTPRASLPHFHLLTTGILLLAAFTTALAAPRFSDLELRQDTNSTVNSTTTPPPPGAGKPIAAGWYPGWLKEKFPPSSVPWELYDCASFAFAVTTSNGSLDLLGEEETLKQFVQEAKAKNVTALLSIGGWTGSRYFSPAVASAKSRTAFVKTITDMVTAYKLDGVDFDWEYPNSEGIGCNKKSGEDTANFLLLLQALRQDPVASTMVITAAAAISPFQDAQGEDGTDMSGFAEVLDYLAIMAYDLNGQWNDPANIGANAPLKAGCDAGTSGSAEEAVQNWVCAGFPAEKLLLGLPAYGHSYEVNVTNVDAANFPFTAAFNKKAYPLGEGETKTMNGTDVCGNPDLPAGGFTFNGLIAAGYLGQDGTAGNGTIYAFDNCTQTPFLYKESEKRIVSFDDAQSYAAKGQFILDEGLAGFAVWHVVGDSKDRLLLNSVHEALGADGNSGNGTVTTVTVTVTAGSATASKTAASAAASKSAGSATASKSTASKTTGSATASGRVPPGTTASVPTVTPSVPPH